MSSRKRARDSLAAALATAADAIEKSTDSDKMTKSVCGNAMKTPGKNRAKPENYHKRP
jgi:hypothetical protein